MPVLHTGEYSVKAIVPRKAQPPQSGTVVEDVQARYLLYRGQPELNKSMGYL